MTTQNRAAFVITDIAIGGHVLHRFATGEAAEATAAAWRAEHGLVIEGVYDVPEAEADQHDPWLEWLQAQAGTDTFRCVA
jgi:hypothetical protein